MFLFAVHGDLVVLQYEVLVVHTRHLLHEFIGDLLLDLSIKFAALGDHAVLIIDRLDLLHWIHDLVPAIMLELLWIPLNVLGIVFNSEKQ